MSLRANVTVIGKRYSKEVKIFEQDLPFDAKCTKNGKECKINKFKLMFGRDTVHVCLIQSKNKEVYL